MISRCPACHHEGRLIGKIWCCPKRHKVPGPSRHHHGDHVRVIFEQVYDPEYGWYWVCSWSEDSGSFSGHEQEDFGEYGCTC
jgi:hypothetical protein